ncbi:MAG: hypothetical protein JXR71_11260 [Bacteroidales bacterium]|nr:hypothetical protein [Bacteroidales bacterium]
MSLFKNIFNDRVSGSGSLLKKLEDELLFHGSSNEIINLPELIDDLQKLKNTFPQFALFHHFITELLNFLSPERDTLYGKQLTTFVHAYKEKWNRSQNRAAEQLLQQISLDKKNVLVHSNSSAIFCLAKLLSERNEKTIFWQTLSSPANEGKIQAQKIRNLHFDVHLFHEDALSKFIHQIDLAIFGADFISDTFFINKTGSFALSLIMQHFHKPVYVLAETRKFIPVKEAQNIMDEAPKPPQEIATGMNDIQVYNYYFESIPLSFTDKIFTEQEPFMKF